MTRSELLKKLDKAHACPESLEWIAKQKRRSSRQLWESCERADWLLWLASRAGVDRRLMVRAACACARAALQYVPEGEERPRIAIETSEAWARGEVSIDRVRAAASAADAAYAAYAAAYYASAAASAAYYAADAAYAAASAAYYAANAAALREMAPLVRSHISWDAIEKGAEW